MRSIIEKNNTVSAGVWSLYMTACLFFEILVHVQNCVSESARETVFGHLKKHMSLEYLWKMVFGKFHAAMFFGQEPLQKNSSKSLS